MYMYGKRFIKNNIESKIASHLETRDAILWDTLPAQRLCRVRIQGSSENITAYYPENWTATPFWLKPGNAVRISHVGGIRGRIEVIGHGRVVPAPVSGGQFPTVATGEDTPLEADIAINGVAGVSSTFVTPCPNNNQMVVLVKTGTFRISGTTYTILPIVMSASSVYKMGMGGILSNIAEAVALDSAPSAPNFRYDIISVGTDLVVDYNKGTNFTTTPVYPTVAASHVELGRILVYGGMTEVTEADIGRTFSAPQASKVNISISDQDLAWAELTSTITVSIVDQYGNSITTGGYGWYITLEIIAGNGTLTSAEEGDSTTIIGGHTGSGSNSYTFTYTRDQLDPGDESPVLEAVLETNYAISYQDYIILRDASGDIM